MESAADGKDKLIFWGADCTRLNDRFGSLMDIRAQK
jgi:hypothetical protein